jgi:hypothetical protein
VSGAASFEDTSGGVVVKLDLRNLPKPDKLYLAHIHPGICAEGEEEGENHEHGEEHGEEEYGHEHGASSHEHDGAEIEYPLSQVKSDSEGHGSSTTTLRDTSVEELFSGEPKHVNVHEAGSGNPPILTCANLNEQDEPVGTRQAKTTDSEATAPTSAPGGVSGEEQAARSEADCRLVLYVADERMSEQEAKAFSELLADMIRTMESPSWTVGDLRNAALDHSAVPRYSECKVREK